MIVYKRASQQEELKQILQLQRDNLPSVLSEALQKKEGFVTVHHDFAMIHEMNEVCPHIIVTDGHQVIGYALCMHPKFGDTIDILKPMFHEIQKVLSHEEPFMVMGQICISKDFRRQGIFRGIYDFMLKELEAEFSRIITEVDTKNTRSLEAHLAVGFTPLARYHSHNRDWALIQLKS